MRLDAPPPLSPLEERVARFLYGITGGTLEVRREIPAPAEVVLDSAGRTMLHPPFELRLYDSDGGHPLDGGTLTFTILRLHGPASSLESVRFRSRLVQIYVRTVDLLLTGTPEGTVAEVRVDLDREVRMGVRWYVGPVFALGCLLGAGAAGLLPAAWVGATRPLLLALGAASGGILSVASFRWFCRKAVHWADEALTTMLEAVEANLRRAAA